MDRVIKEIKEFNKERDWDKFHTPANLAKSISIESAELLECFQWSESEFNEQKCKRRACRCIYVLYTNGNCIRCGC